MPQARLSNYANAEYNPEDPNPLHLSARASTTDGHEFGDAGEVYFTDEEGRELRSFLNEIYG